MKDSLRQDDRQWLIHEEESVTAAVESVEVLALQIAGNLLTEAPDVEVRAAGHIMLRWADSRTRTMEKGDPFEQVAIKHMRAIFEYISGGEKPEAALNEIHAAVFSFDSTLKAAGITGDGWAQELARGEHGR